VPKKEEIIEMILEQTAPAPVVAAPSASSTGSKRSSASASDSGASAASKSDGPMLGADGQPLAEWEIELAEHEGTPIAPEARRRSEQGDSRGDERGCPSAPSIGPSDFDAALAPESLALAELRFEPVDDALGAATTGAGAVCSRIISIISSFFGTRCRLHAERLRDCKKLLAIFCFKCRLFKGSTSHIAFFQGDQNFRRPICR